jgi:teichuronic acid biosynthesis glycosyltransferase TuaC
MTPPAAFERGVVVITTDYPAPRTPHVGTFVHERYRTIAANGIPVRVVAPARLPRRPPLSHQLDGVDVVRPRYLSPGVRWPLAAARRRASHRGFESVARRAVKEQDPPSALIGVFLRPGGVAAIRIGEELGVPSVLQLGEGRLTRADREWADPEDGALARRATAVVAASEPLAAVARDEFGVDADRVGVFPNGIDPAKFHPGDRRRARQALGLPLGDVLVAFCGRLTPSKGTQHVVDAVRRVGRVRALFIGAGPVRPRGPQFVRTGPVAHDRVGEYLRAADVFVLPSLEEGCPNAVLEAMATGLPLVVSDRPFMREVVPPGAASFIDPHSVAEIADAIADLAADTGRRRQMGEVAAAADRTIEARVGALLEWLGPRVGAAARS